MDKPASSGRQHALTKTAAVGKRGSGRNHAWINDKEFMAAVELARRPWAVPDIFDVKLRSKVTLFYEYANLEEAFFVLAPMSLNEALTFMFLAKGWTCNDFIDNTDLSDQFFYDIIGNVRKGTILRASLLSILYPLAPGLLIGDRILELGGVCIAILSYKIRKVLGDCRSVDLHEVRQLFVHENIYNVTPIKLSK
ncbi:hypothetical protein FACS1894184_15900 [Clostridia bacterium]|nr:hypothetical protein FACS1894184_15900 [Clostridia bacterium]